MKLRKRFLAVSKGSTNAHTLGAERDDHHIRYSILSRE